MTDKTLTLEFQSTLPARGATLSPSGSVISSVDFNPRSPHGERPAAGCCSYRWKYFNPRSPHGERHYVMSQTQFTYFNFNPRSPHGERHYVMSQTQFTYFNFNPRSPHGERRNLLRIACHEHNISIHAPRTGSDGIWSENVPMALNFNPRSPHGERHVGLRHMPHVQAFQSTLPARGATR